MKYINKTIKLALVTATFFLISCNKEKFAEYNSNPDAVSDVAPEPIFAKAITNWHADSFEAFYDNYRGVSRWTRQFVGRLGNAGSVTDGIGNLNSRYGRFYLQSGNLLVDVQKVIDKMTTDQQARYVQVKAIAEIIKVYEAWYVTDANGSIPYSQAFQARYGGTLTPIYDTQQALYDNFDQSLKVAVSTLKAVQPTPQSSLGVNDLYFKGDVAKWIKAATSLRFKIATRLINVDPAKMKSIVTDILTNNATDLMQSENDDWSLKAGARIYDGSGNWDVSASGAYGANGTVDFMFRNKDPRLTMFYSENSWTQARFTQAKTENKIPQSSIFDTRRYYGQYTSPDAATSTIVNIKNFFTPVVIGTGSATTTLDTVSSIQYRMFYPPYSSGTGTGTFLVLTYADICLLRAELAARGVTAENAQNLYYEGIRASIVTYDRIANAAKVDGYAALTATAISNYQASTDIVYNSGKAIEQIVSQQYLNHFKDYNEAWALLRRTNLPNSTSSLKIEDFVLLGAKQDIPRRYVVGFPLAGDSNFDNKQKAIADMVLIPYFGQPSDVKGRVWWDKP